MEEDYNKYFADQHEVTDQRDEISFKIDFNLEEYDFAADYNRSQEKSTHSNEFFLQKMDEQSASRNYLEDKTCTKHGSFLANKTKIFNIVRDDQPQQEQVEQEEEEGEENESMNISPNTKAINKKEKSNGTKSKNSPINGFPDVDSQWVNKQIEEEMKEYQHLDEKSKKKMVQMLRNRISAQTSRDRKKYYVGTLEKENQELKVQNNKLRAKVKELEDTGAGYSKEYICKACKRSENASSTGFNLLETNSTRENNDIEVRTNSVGHSPGRIYTFFALLSVVMLVAIVSNNYDGGVTRSRPIALHEIRVLPHEEPITPVESVNSTLLSQGMCCKNH
jgi:hypothetical protein